MGFQRYADNAGNLSPPTPIPKFTDPVKFAKDVESYFDSISVREEIYEKKLVYNEETEENELQEVATGKYSVKWLTAPTMVGLGVYMDTDYRRFFMIENHDYSDNTEIDKETVHSLRNTISRARQICHSYTLDRVFNAKSANGPIFVLKTVYKDHGYQEEININQNVTTNENEELSLDNLSTDELKKLQSTLDKAFTDKQHQIAKQSAEDIEYEDE